MNDQTSPPPADKATSSPSPVVTTSAGLAKPWYRSIFLYASLLIIAASTVGVYAWQHKKVTNLNNQVRQLSTQVADLQKASNNTSSESSGSSETGAATLTGTVTQSPSSPICPSSGSCSSAVANHTIEALNSSGQAVASTKTDDKGVYTLKLQPGTYTLKLVPAVGMGVIKNNTIAAKAGVNHFDLNVDTGIR